jgi:hypothetical protein
MTIPRNLSNLAPGASTGGVLSASYGGTGLATLTANNVLLGNGTSALQVVAPGASGNALTSDGTTWASTTPPAPGSWVYLSTVTASAAATADIETTFDSTYENYAIVASGIQLSASTTTYIRFKISGAYSSSALYAYAQAYNTGAATGAGGSSANQIVLTPGSPTASSAISNNFICYVYNPLSSSLYKICNIVGHSWNGGTITNFTTSAFYNAITPLTGVRFLGASGTITGTFRLYGIKNS